MGEQIKEEVTGCLEFMKYVYDTFGMSYRLELSTRPKKALGEQALWDRAEAALAASMDDVAGKGDWKENPGDGAFYGPKIDLKVMDAMDRAVERMFAVLLEHYGGKWPFWLSPRQALVVPVGMKYVPYARDVRDRLKAAGFHADADDSTNSLKKKVREGQLAQYNYILVVGETEEENDSVAVRNRSNEQEGEKKVEEIIAEFAELRESHKY